MGGKYLMADPKTLNLGKIETVGDVTTIGSIMFNDGSEEAVVGKKVTVAAGSAKNVAMNAVSSKN